MEMAVREALVSADSVDGLNNAAAQLASSPFFAERCRAAAAKALDGRSPVEHLISRGAAGDAVGAAALRAAGALAGAAGATPRELGRLLALAAPARHAPPVAAGAVMALRDAFRAAAAARRTRQPPGRAYFDLNGGSLEVPTLPWRAPARRPPRPPAKEYAVSLWCRVPERRGARVELARLMTAEDLGVVIALEAGDPTPRLTIEASHAPAGAGQGTVSQRTSVPLPGFRWGAWHHLLVEGRGRGRLSVFGRDELSAWLDGAKLLDRIAFLFPTATWGAELQQPSTARRRTPARTLDDCAFGRGLAGQLACVAVASWDARRALGAAALEPGGRHGHLAGGAAAAAPRDALEALGALGGAGLVLALFDHLRTGGLEVEDGPSGAALLLEALEAAKRGPGHAAELLRLQGPRLAQTALARAGRAASAAASRDAENVAAAVWALQGGAAPLAAQAAARLGLHAVFGAEAACCGRARAHPPRELRDALADVALALAKARPAAVAAVAGVGGLLDLARGQRRTRPRRVLLACCAALVAKRGLGAADAGALLGVLTADAGSGRAAFRDAALARDAAKLLLGLLAGAQRRPLLSCLRAAAGADEDDNECAFEAFLARSLVAQSREPLRAAGVALITASLAAADAGERRRRADATAALVESALTRRLDGVAAPTYAALLQMTTLPLDADAEALEAAGDDIFGSPFTREEAEDDDGPSRALTEKAIELPKGPTAAEAWPPGVVPFPAAPLALLCRLLPRLAPALKKTFLRDCAPLLADGRARRALAACPEAAPCFLALADSTDDEVFSRATRALALLARELLPSGPDVLQRTLAACGGGRPVPRRTLRAAVSRCLANAHRLPAEAASYLVFAGCALVENRPSGAPRRGRAARRRDRAIARDDRDDVANVILALQARDAAASVLGLAGGRDARAPARGETARRTKAIPRLYSNAGSLCRQPALVFELLRATRVALSALDPATREHVVAAGWARFLVAAALDVFGPPAEPSSTLSWALEVTGSLFAPPAIDDDPDEQRETAGWILTTVDALRAELRGVRDVGLAPEAEPHRLAAAAAFAREAAAALRDCLERRRSPLPRFLGESRAFLRQALDEASICRGVARSLRDRARNPLAGAPAVEEDGSGDEGLWAAAEAPAEEDLAPLPVARPRPRPAEPPKPPRPPSHPENAAARRAELGWLRCEWLVQRTAEREDALSVAAKHVAKVAGNAVRRGLTEAADTGAAQRVEAAAAFAVLTGADVVAAAADAQRRRRRGERDSARDALKRAAARDAAAADRCMRRLRGSLAGWSPVAEAPKRWRLATSHVNAQGRRGMLVPARVRDHRDRAYGSRPAPKRPTGRAERRWCADARRVVATRREKAEAPGDGDSDEARTLWPSSASSSSGGESEVPSSTSEEDSDDSDVAPIRAIKEPLQATGQCLASYKVLWVRPAGVAKGELRVTAMALWFLPQDMTEPRRWRLDGLTAVRGRRHLLRQVALEFYFCARREAFFAFESAQARRVCWRAIKLEARVPLCAHPAGGTRTMRSPQRALRALGLQERWCRGEIPTLEYLLALNSLAGRTYSDLAQYPVVPWVLADFSSPNLPLELRESAEDGLVRAARRPSASSLPAPLSPKRAASNDDLEGSESDEDDVDVASPRNATRRLSHLLARPRTEAALITSPKPVSGSFYRDLRKPVGALEPRRLQAFLERYGSHYSSAGVVLHYLLRVEPFTTLALQLQGGCFDVPDRLFHSVPASWRGCTSNMGDVRELVPELFYLPEALVNRSGYPLGALQSGAPVDDVVLPPWARGDPRAFSRALMGALETRAVVDRLPKWLDLVFGPASQRGAAAVAENNVFHPLTYEGGVDLDAVQDETLKAAAEAQIQHFGQTPAKLFDKPHPLKRPDAGGALFDDHHRASARVATARRPPPIEVPRSSKREPRSPRSGESDTWSKASKREPRSPRSGESDHSREPNSPRSASDDEFVDLDLNAPAQARPQQPQSPPLQVAESPVVALMAAGRKRIVAVHADGAVATLYASVTQKGVALRLDARRRPPYAGTSRARLASDPVPETQRPGLASAALAARAAGRAWHGARCYALVLATPGNANGVALAVEPHGTRVVAFDGC